MILGRKRVILGLFGPFLALFKAFSAVFGHISGTKRVLFGFHYFGVNQAKKQICFRIYFSRDKSRFQQFNFRNLGANEDKKYFVVTNLLGQVKTWKPRALKNQTGLPRRERQKQWLKTGGARKTFKTCLDLKNLSCFLFFHLNRPEAGVISAKFQKLRPLGRLFARERARINVKTARNRLDFARFINNLLTGREIPRFVQGPSETNLKVGLALTNWLRWTVTSNLIARPTLKGWSRWYGMRKDGVVDWL